MLLIPQVNNFAGQWTLAGIYIKQGRYKKALDIMNRINKKATKKNLYFEDQKRFLAKLIANQKTK